MLSATASLRPSGRHDAAGSGEHNLTEVVVQLYVGTEAFSCATVINGGHNWPGPTTVGNPPVAAHFDATAAIVDFWHAHAALP